MKIFLEHLNTLRHARSWRELLRYLSWIFYDAESIRQMMVIVSKKVMHETVLIYIKPPIVKGLIGQAYLISPGIRVIDIHPDAVKRGLNMFYLTWLHELGHHAYHHDLAMRPPEIVEAHWAGALLLEPTEQQLSEHEIDPCELEANSFLSEMDQYANRKASTEFGGNSIRERIRALMITNFSYKEN